MRTLTAGETSALAGAGQGTRMRVRRRHSATSSTYYDLTSLEGEDFVTEIRCEESQDDRFAKATFGLQREIEKLSLAQLVTGSKTQSYGAGALIKPGAEVVVEVATVAPMTPPDSGDWKEVFRGDIVSSNWADGVMQVEALDLGHRLQRMFLETERTYGSGAGTAAETVIQQIIDDGHGQPYAASTAYVVGNRVHPTTRNGYFYECTTAGTSGAEPAWTTTIGNTNTTGTATFTCKATIPTLYVPASPSFLIVTYIQQREPVFDAIYKIAQLFGWDLRYRWDTGTGAFRLTLFDPNRTKATVDRTWTASEYLAIEDAAIGWEDVRNLIEGVYSDPADLDAAGVPKRKTIQVSDATSIATYERRFMQLAEAATSLIDTAAEMTAMLTAIRDDLKDPVFSHRVALPIFYAAQLGDRYTFEANGVHYDADQTLAVVGIAHSQRAGEAGMTVVQCRGKPVAAVREWLLIEARPGVAPSPPFVAPDAPTNVTVARTVGGLVVTFDPPSVGEAREFEVHISKTAAFTISAATLACTVAGNRAELGDLDYGDTYYCRVVARDGSGNRGSESAEVSIAAGYVTPAAVGHGGFAEGFMPPNGNFLLLDVAGAPDGWTLSGPVATDSFSRSGDKSLKFSSTGPATAWSDLFPVPGGGRAVVRSLYYQDVAPSGAWYDRVAVYFYAANQTTLLSFADKQLPTSVGAWGVDEMWVDVPASARYAWVLFEAVGSTHNHNVWLDAIQMEYEQQGIWITPSFSNAWVNSGGALDTAGYRKDIFGCVHLKGSIKSGTLGATAFTLPSGYRPAATRTFPAVSVSGGTQQLCRVVIASDGTVKPTGGTNAEFSLDGVLFRVD